ncbi:hypothetical protein K0U83_16975, partial [bacterium]|nr:hypothetical protein [bacterium]
GALMWPAILAVLLGACGPTWDLDKPFAPLHILAPVDGTEAATAFSSSIEELGGRVAKNGTQHVTLDLDEKCNCGNCTALPFRCGFRPFARNTQARVDSRFGPAIRSLALRNPRSDDSAIRMSR